MQPNKEQHFLTYISRHVYVTIKSLSLTVITVHSKTMKEFDKLIERNLAKKNMQLMNEMNSERHYKRQDTKLL